MDGLNVFYWNTQSITNKLDYISVLTNDVNADVVCVVEHWLSSQELSVVNIPGYYLVSSYCRPKHGLHGGSAIFVKENIIVNQPIDLSNIVLQNIFEASCIFIPELNAFCISLYLTSGFSRSNFDIFTVSILWLPSTVYIFYSFDTYLKSSFLP